MKKVALVLMLLAVLFLQGCSRLLPLAASGYLIYKVIEEQQ